MARAPGPVKQARGIVGAQYAPIDYAAAKAAQRASKEQAALAASGKALVGLLQNGVTQDTQMYDQALGQTDALAKGAAQLLAQANPNAQIQQDLAQVNAPPEQQAKVAQSLQAQFPGQAAVLNVQNGSIPGASLVAQKAAEQGYLAGLPTVAALSGQQSLRGLLAKAADEQQGFQQQRMQIGAQLPALVNQLTEQAYGHQQNALNRIQHQQDQQFQARQAAIDRAAALVVTPYQQKQLDLDQKRLNADKQAALPTVLDQYKAETDRINAKRERQSALAGGAGASLQYKHNSDGSLDIFNPKTGKIRHVKGASGGGGGFTPHELQDYRGRATGLAAAARKGVPAEGTPGSASFKPALPPITYNEAIGEMEKEGIPIRVAVAALNRVYPSQYRVTSRGLKQTGIKQGLRKKKG